MRPIKFRAKIKEDYERTGEWLFFALNDFVDSGLFGDYSDHLDLSCVDLDTVGLFTTLHDKNGKEIYEGDIVRLEKGIVTEMAEIVFQEGCFVLECKHWYWSGECLREHYDECEVIGNIYENPELLEEGNENT